MGVLADDGESFSRRTCGASDRLLPDPLDVAFEHCDGIVNIALAQKSQDRAMVMIRPHFPIGTPGGKQETRAYRMKVINRGKQPRHAAWHEDQPVKPPVCLLPRAHIPRIVPGNGCLFSMLQN